MPSKPRVTDIDRRWALAEKVKFWKTCSLFQFGGLNLQSEWAVVVFPTHEEHVDAVVGTDVL